MTNDLPDETDDAVAITHADRQLLTGYGLTDATIDALGVVWADPLTSSLYNHHVTTMRGFGMSVAATYDALRHNLSGSKINWCEKFGLTPHQAALIRSSNHATGNLMDRDFEGPHGMSALHYSRVQGTFLMHAAFVADDPQDVDKYFDRWRAADAGTPLPRDDGATDTTDLIEAEVAMLYGHQTPPPLNCGCPEDR